MFDLPETLYLVVVRYPDCGLASGGDVTTDIDDAADQAAEVLDKEGADVPFRVLRIADSLNCDDVTADVLDVIARRRARRAAA